MSLIKKLGTNLFTALCVLTISTIVFAATSFLINTDYQDIPFGFLLSGALVALSYFVTHILLRIDEKHKNNISALIAVIAKFIIDVTSLLMLGFMYYRWDIKLFNIFTYVGVFTFGTIIYALSHVISKKGEVSE